MPCEKGNISDCIIFVVGNETRQSFRCKEYNQHYAVTDAVKSWVLK